MNYNIFAEDCLNTRYRLADKSVDLGIYDPPFGLQETGFEKHYKRDSSHILQGYQEAPENYAQWTLEWLSEATRVLKDNGSMYIFMGNTNLRHLLNAAASLGLHEVNHIIWKYNFGVFTKNKYVTSHYHVLYYSKSIYTNRVFNTYCRFGSQEKDSNNRSLLYKDLEDVFILNKDYAPKESKNQNKLPEELIKKLILYSSNPNDTVCDFFMGNFTTAYVALKLGRNVVGYEINKYSYDLHMNFLKDISFGSDLDGLKVVDNITPLNQGKKITSEERKNIYVEYQQLLLQGLKKIDISQKLQEKYGRGKFAIKNIIDNEEAKR